MNKMAINSKEPTFGRAINRLSAIFQRTNCLPGDVGMPRLQNAEDSQLPTLNSLSCGEFVERMCGECARKLANS